MRAYLHAGMVALVAAGTSLPASGMTRDEASVGELTILTLGPDEDIADVRQQLEDWLDSGVRVALTGPSSILDEVRPEGIHAWPSTNTIVLDPGAGLGIFGFDAADAAQRIAILREWPWADDPEMALRMRRSGHGPSGGARLHSVTFDLSATSPSAACQSFRRKMTSSLFSSTAPTGEERRAFRKEMRRWCQYGNVSFRQADMGEVRIEPFQWSLDPRLSVLAEWALLRNEDPVDSRTVTYLFWAKTVGDGAGSGFSRQDGREAYFDDKHGGITRLLDASIHSGWGPLAGDNLISSWPLTSSYPGTGNVNIFICERPGERERPQCPRELRLRGLFPADSSDGVVTVSLAERFIVGGTAQANISADNAGKLTPGFSFSLNVVQAKTKTAQSSMQLAQTRSNADTVFYRTTRWTPDVPAIYRWINSRNHRGNLAQATPLAATLNPHYEILWELPLKGNEGRRLAYHMVYEAGWNTCFNGPNCTTHLWPPDRTFAPKSRMFWKDSLRLKIPGK